MLCGLEARRIADGSGPVRRLLRTRYVARAPPRAAHHARDAGVFGRYGGFVVLAGRAGGWAWRRLGLHSRSRGDPSRPRLSGDMASCGLSLWLVLASAGPLRITSTRNSPDSD